MYVCNRYDIKPPSIVLLLESSCHPQTIHLTHHTFTDQFTSRPVVVSPSVSYMEARIRNFQNTFRNICLNGTHLGICIVSHTPPTLLPWQISLTPALCVLFSYPTHHLNELSHCVLLPLPSITYAPQNTNETSSTHTHTHTLSRHLISPVIIHIYFPFPSYNFLVFVHSH